nr:tripartite motif-containing protein 15-like [Pelodiscus sinensis]|eukprot:XP_025036185.1 tripartite motif-containing protein 15-like [Pelodiscus sinensis]
MAAAEPLQNIKAEVTCPICQELFLDPVTSECGHSFCRECIAQHCQGDRDIACPLCNEKLRKGNLRPNRELKNIVELVKSQAVEDPRGGYVCKMHREPLRFYCKEDETPVCMACERSRAHRAHTVVPVEEAVQEHKEDAKRLTTSPAEATLDSDTAYPQLVLSKDRKSVRLGDTLQDLPDNPGRFCSSFAVLGSEGFTSGRHYWEVEVGAGGGWGIGVSKGYVKRKSRSSFNAKKGIWALTSSHPPPSFCETPQLIGVFLDYAGGKVTFFDAENMIPLLTHSAKFTGKIFPFFRLRTKSSYLKLSPCRR